MTSGCTRTCRRSTSRATTRARKFINHETGHVLGLKDPAGYGTDCQDSVMHNDLYGCPATVWYPTANDKASVTRIANYQNTN